MGFIRTGIFGLIAILPAAAQNSVSVVTYHNDLSRSGANPLETVLTTANVNTNMFGKLYSLPVDDQIYAQPLYVQGVNIAASGIHNILFVVTLNNSVYAFDADTSSTPLLWKVNLGTPVVSYWYDNIVPHIGIVSTPVIDITRQAIYVVSYTTVASKRIFSLHSLDLRTGAERVGSPVTISGQVAGTGDGSVNGVLAFDPDHNLQRPGLTEVNGNIYIGFGARADSPPYHGWIFGYDGLSMRRVALMCTTPNSYGGGVWQSGGGLAADPSGNLYLGTGNGLFNPATGDWGDVILKLNAASGLAITSYYTSDNAGVDNQAYMEANDQDLGAGAVIVMPGASRILASGKIGNIYMLNTVDLGGYSFPSKAVQDFTASPRHISTNVFYNNALYTWGSGDYLGMSLFNGSQFAGGASNRNYQLFYDYSNSPTMSISSNGGATGSTVLWASHSQTYANGSLWPGLIHAYDGHTLTELWNSGQRSADYAGSWAKMVPPTVANGKVYLATFDNVVLVYGLFGANRLTVSPSPTIFTYKAGATAPPAQYLSIASSTGSGLNYTASVATGGSWLQLSNPSSSTPTSNYTSVSVNTAGLTAGSYSGTITVSAPNASNSPITVPVTLTVSANSLTASPAALSFTYAAGATAPAMQYLNIGSAGSGLSYSASVSSGASWLQLTNPNSVTPSSNYTGISINTAGLTVGTYNGAISIAGTGASNSPLSVPVTLTVTANNLTSSPTTLSFNYAVGATAPAAQYLNIASAGAGLNYTASVSAGASWLQITNPVSVTPSSNYTGISVNTAGLAVGTYNAGIIVTGTGASNSPLTVPVTLTVTANNLTATPASMSFNYQFGASAPAGQYLNITSTGAGLSYTASVTAGASWLQLTNPGGTTPSAGNTVVSVNASGLAAGTYNGTVSVAAAIASNSPITVPVTLTVTTNTLSVAPGSLSFSFATGGTAPAAKYLNVTSTGPGISYTATVTAGAPWLQVTNPGGTTPSPNNTAISVNTSGLATGVYSGTISVSAANASNSPVTVPVTLTVSIASLVVSPGQLSFSYRSPAVPAAQYLNITSTGAGLNYTASVTAGAPWLQVTNPGGSTPSSNSTGVSVNPAGLSAGTYNGVVSVASGGSDPVAVPVTLTVLPSTAGPVQQNVGTGTTATLTIPISPPMVGNALIATIASSSATQVASIAGGGVTWYRAQSSHTVKDAEIWYGLNSSGSGTSVVVTFPGSVTSEVNISEWSGILNSPTPFDGSGFSVTSSLSTAVTGTVVLSDAGSLIVACVSAGSAPHAPDQGFVSLTTAAQFGSALGAAFDIPGATGSFHTDWGLVGKGTVEIVIIAFLP